jgi:hypothetical protein
MGGKKGRCPSCKSVIDIPKPGVAAAKPAAVSQQVAAKPKAKPVLQPLASAPLPSLQPIATPSLQPLGPAGGLQPLGPVPSPGLQPLGPVGGAPFGGGLQPLGPVPSLTPLGGPAADPFGGLQPLGPGPFGGAPSSYGGPTGFGGPAIPDPYAPAPLPGAPSTLAKNPYSSPSSASYTPQLDDPRQRRGLPWQREQDFDAFSATVKQVLFGFPSCFRRMRVEGGIGSAMGFVVSANIVAVIAIALFNFLLNMVFTLIIASTAPDERGAGVAGFVLVMALLGLLMYIVLGSMMAAIGAMIGSFITAGIYHVCLLVVGGANRGFETTYQVGCYATGAAAMLSAVPIVGPLIALFLFPVILIFGLMHAHCTSGMRATLAVLLPYMLCLGFIGFIVAVAFLPLLFGR